MAGELPSYKDLPVVPGAPPHSAWGLWGPEDQLGCLNLLGPEQTRRATAAVRVGETIGLNARLDIFDPPLFGRSPHRHDVEAFGKAADIRDETLSGLNTQASSQWDGFRHVKSRWYGYYNGLEESALGIEAWARRGIAGRGILLDVEAWRDAEGRSFAHATSDPIPVAELEGLLAARRIDVEPGDILVVHTGWLGWAAEQEGPVDKAAPGLRPGRDMLEFLWNLHPAGVVSDTPSLEVWPPAALATPEQRAQAREDPQAIVDVFMHSELLALLGLPLGELWDTGPLARRLRERGGHDFLLASAPMHIPHGVATISNAVAVV